MNDFRFGLRAIYQKNIRAAILEAKNNGFDVLEIHLSAPQFQPRYYTQSQLKDIKTSAQKSGITLQIHSEIGQSLLQANEHIRKAEKQRVKDTVQFSSLIGARALTLHAGNAPTYHASSEVFRNELLYPKYYTTLFEDSLKHIVSIAPKDFLICIENDNSTEGFRKVLSKFLKTNKIFLTWDIMKNFQYKPNALLYPKLWDFMKKNTKYVRNVHISGPSHGGMEGYEKDFAPLLKLLLNKDIPIIIEILSLEASIKTKHIIQNMNLDNH